MKLLLTVTFVFATGAIFAQINSNTTAKKPIKKTSAANSESQTLRSSNNVSRSSTNLEIPKYLKYRDKALHALKVYDKTVIPSYNKQKSEEENINILVKWAYNNLSLFKDEKREKIEIEYHKRF